MSNENVTIIDGVKYREVKRKAKAGDWVIYKESGRVAKCFDEHLYAVNCSTETFTSTANMCSDMRVLEPVRDTESDICDLIELQRQLNEVRSQQTELTKQIDGLTDAFAKLLAAKTLVGTQLNDVSPRSKSRQAQRDEIVAQAKRDVAELLAKEHRDVPAMFDWYPIYYPDRDTVDFHVNRDKRTVVALIKFEGHVWAKGIAKAAPGDVFNEFIGRAIALRRALGLEVPAEYTHAPQPEGFEIGDVIWYSDKFPYETVSDVNSPSKRKINKQCINANLPYSNIHVIDDSDRYTSETTEVSV